MAYIIHFPALLYFDLECELLLAWEGLQFDLACGCGLFIGLLKTMAKCDDSISEEDPLVDSSCDEEGKIIIIHDPRDEDSINKEVDPLLVSDSLHHRTSPGSPSPLTCIEPQGFVLLLALISALGGFLFGYDTGVVSGAIIMIRDTFSLKSLWLEIIVSGTIAAAAVSAFLTGFINDLIGRKLTLIAASIIFTIGSVILGVSYHPYMLLIGRVIVGVGIGMAASTVPMYIAESAPVNMRGRLVVLYVLFITGGQFVATVVDGAFSYLQYNIGWRYKPSVSRSTHPVVKKSVKGSRHVFKVLFESNMFKGNQTLCEGHLYCSISTLEPLRTLK